jgi:hypothetical protein
MCVVDRLAAAPLVLLLLVAGGCSQPQPVGPTVNLSGYSQPFKDGFAAGCKTARGNPTKDAERHRSDTDYRLGWEDGLSVCAKK